MLDKESRGVVEEEKENKPLACNQLKENQHVRSIHFNKKLIMVMSKLNETIQVRQDKAT